MKKFILSLLAMVLILVTTSCTDSKTFQTSEGMPIVAEPYGFLTQDKKVDGVIYKKSVGNIVLAVIFSETIVVPAYVLLADLYYPVSYIEPTTSTPNAAKHQQVEYRDKQE